MRQNVVNVNLEAFLRTGVFGAIEFGLTSDRILKMLGEPDFIFTSGKNRKPTGFEYGDAELYFVSSVNNRLCSIYFDEFKIPEGSQNLVIDACWLRAEMSQIEAEIELTQAGIKFQSTRMPDPTMSGILTEGGVTLGFIFEADEHTAPTGLYNISCELRDKMRVVETKQDTR